MAFWETPHSAGRRVRPFPFLAMSFDKKLDAIAKVIRQTIMELGIDCSRVDDAHFTGPIADRIARNIREANFVIAEISDPRPNVLYEVGYAQGIGRPMILVTKKKSIAPFDVAHLNLLRYDTFSELRHHLKQAVIDVVLTNHATYGTRRGKFGGLALRNDRLLCASIRPETRRKNSWCRVVLEVASLDPKRPLRGKATFYLHRSFDPKTEEVECKNGVARLVISSHGRFTVGAETDAGKTQLELDLGSVPGGTPRFYTR